MTVNLARIYYPVKTLGPGNRVGIWLSGCDRCCEGCVTPELKSTGSGKPIEVSEIIGYIKKYCALPDGFTISGGEPFMDALALRMLVSELAGICEDIIIYSGYTLKELKRMNDDNVDFVLDNISVLIDGPYIDGLNDGKGLRGSSNQRINIFKDPERYKDLSDCERSMQVVGCKDGVMTIGIPAVNDCGR